jgi:hypothetical protein
VDDIDIEVMPGVPDTGIQQTDEGKAAYPNTTVDIIKVFREQGMKVEWHHSKEDRAEVSHKAADIWLPVLAFTSQVCANTAGALFAQAIIDLFGPRKAENSILHVEFERVRGKDRQKFKATGRGADVLESMRKFDGDDDSGSGDSIA